MVAGWDKTGPHLYMVDDTGDHVLGEKFSVGSGCMFAYGVLDDGYHIIYHERYIRYRYDLSVEEAVELGRRSIYHATHRDGASGGVVRV